MCINSWYTLKVFRNYLMEFSHIYVPKFDYPWMVNALKYQTLVTHDWNGRALMITEESLVESFALRDPRAAETRRALSSEF